MSARYSSPCQATDNLKSILPRTPDFSGVIKSSNKRMYPGKYRVSAGGSHGFYAGCAGLSNAPTHNQHRNSLSDRVFNTDDADVVQECSLRSCRLYNSTLFQVGEFSKARSVESSRLSPLASRSAFTRPRAAITTSRWEMRSLS